jgi:hypothetical protein
MQLMHVYFFVIRELVPLTKRDCRARDSLFFMCITLLMSHLISSNINF